MLAIEFETQSQNGIIKIPERYKELYSKNLKLIALYEKTNQNKTKEMKFEAVKIKTKGFKFSRDQAHER